VNGEPNAEDSGASAALHIVVDIPDSPVLIVITSNDEEEEEPEEEIEPEEDEGNQAFMAQLKEELQEEGYEEEPQGAVQKPSSEESMAFEDSKVSYPDYDPSRDH